MTLDVSGWVLLLVGGWLAATISGVAGFGGALFLLLPAALRKKRSTHAFSLLVLSR